jgi:hypothetical protein
MSRANENVSGNTTARSRRGNPALHIYPLLNASFTRNSHSSRSRPKSLKINGRAHLYPERPGASHFSQFFRCGVSAGQAVRLFLQAVRPMDAAPGGAADAALPGSEKRLRLHGGVLRRLRRLRMSRPLRPGHMPALARVQRDWRAMHVGWRRLLRARIAPGDAFMPASRAARSISC